MGRLGRSAVVALHDIMPGSVQITEGGCDPFDCSDPVFVAMVWAGRLLILGAVGWVVYRLTRMKSVKNLCIVAGVGVLAYWLAGYLDLDPPSGMTERVGRAEVALTAMLIVGGFLWNRTRTSAPQKLMSD